MPNGSKKIIKVSARVRRLYEQRDKKLDHDPDAPTLPPEKWANAMTRDEFLNRPLKKQLTVRIDSDVLDWLKSTGSGYLTRLNDVLRAAMIASR